MTTEQLEDRPAPTAMAVMIDDRDAGPAKQRARMTLAEVDAYLASDAHYNATPSRNYGPHHPVKDALGFIWRCRCGSQTSLAFDVVAEKPARRADAVPPEQGRRLHYVLCDGCGRKGQPGILPWQAVVEWNRSNPDTAMSIREFPFFLLAGLSLEEASAKLAGIRTDLELRRTQAKLRSRAGIETGRSYRERLDAYLRWAIVAQALAAAHIRAMQRDQAERAAALRQRGLIADLA